jgi:hypothetical protein
MKKASQFHENFARVEKLPLASNRSFCLLLAALFGILAMRAFFKYSSWHGYAWGAACGILLIIAFTRPALLEPLNRIWSRFSLLLSRVTTPVFVTLIYCFTIVPIGIFMRASGKSGMRNVFDSKTKTYWIMRDPAAPSAKTLEKQF